MTQSDPEEEAGIGQGPPKRPRQDLGDELEDEEVQDFTAVASDAAYFEAYDTQAVHLLMLADKSRVEAYAAAIRLAAGNLRGKVVLDVGAGTGILSLLVAKLAAPKVVYAVEATPSNARIARDLVRRNGMEDIVKVVEGRVEQVELPCRVDALISEWMGHYLLHESMLESVLVARDRWLQPNGLMLPSSAKIFAALIEDEALRQEIETIRSGYGLDLGPLADAREQEVMKEPQLTYVEADRLITSPREALDLEDLTGLKQNATESLSAKLDFIALRAGRVAAVAVWFDVGFGQVVLATGPGSPRTHWKQAVVYLGQFVPVEAGDMLPLRLLLERSPEDPRHYNITVET